MKKLLSILICVLLGVSSTWAADYSGKIVLRAISTPQEGGQVKVTGGYSYGSLMGSKGWTTETTSWGVDVSNRLQHQSGWVMTKTYSGQLEAKVNDGYYFAGWATNVNGSDATGTETKTVTISYSEDDNGEKKFYAIFKHKPIVQITTTATLSNSSMIDDVPMGYVLVSESATAADADINRTTHNYTSTERTVDKNAEYSCYYHAKPASSQFKFAGWSRNADGTNIISTDRHYKVTGTAVNEYPTPNDVPDETLYAVFEINPVYYYEGPTADFATNYSSPRGQIYCDQAGIYYSNQTNVPWSDTKISDVDAQGNIKSYSTGEISYSVYYYATPHVGYSFKGWSSRKDGSNILSTSVAYKYTHETFKDGAHQSSMDEMHPDPSFTLYAVFESYFYNSPAVAVADNSVGLGKVAVKTPAAYPADAEWKDAITTRTKNNVATASYPDGYPFSYYYYIKAELGASFKGWSLTADGESIVDLNYLTAMSGTNGGNTYTYYKGDYTTKVTNEKYPYTPPTLYAVFGSLLNIKQQDRMIFYRDDQGKGYINDASLLIDLSGATTLTATLADDGISRQYFQLFNETLTQKGNEIVADATTGLIQLRLNYKGDLAEALDPTPKSATIQLTGKNSSGTVVVSRNVTITIEETPLVTFIPTDGKGVYTITHTDGSGISYTMAQNQMQSIQVAVSHESMSFLEMNLTNDVADDFEFYGWQVYENYGQADETYTYISKEKLCSYRFNKAVTVKPEFIPTTWSRYIIKSNPEVEYYDFAEVLEVANENIGDGSEYPDNKVVVVKTNGRLPLGAYTIPEGVSVLVPSDETYRILTTLGTDDYTTTNKTKKAYSTWTIESGTTIDVKGTLYIHSYLTSTNPYSRPFQYGHIVMEDHSKITVKDNAKLCAYGYISGANSASVLAETGAVVYETFQLCDWRGGNATADIVLENYSTNNSTLQAGIQTAGAAGLGDGTPNYPGVFPANHYYIQNIEIPITFEAGANERLSAGIDVKDLNVVEAPFIGTNTGFFRLQQNATLTKYYDVATDRMKFIMTGTTDEGAMAALGNITLDVDLMSIVSLTVDSKDYNMPVPPNYDIEIKNLDMTIMYDILMLPGSTINIDKNSSVVLDGGGQQYDRWISWSLLGGAKYETVRRTASLYILDKEWYNRNYYGAVAGKPQYEMINVGYRPGGATIASRTTVEDAKIVVDGSLTTAASNGFVYTTTTNDADKTNFGANITSNGGGMIKWNSPAVENYVNQATQNNTDISYVQLPITAAKLHNADGGYVSPNIATAYYYCDGVWGTSQCMKPTIPDTDYTPKFAAEAVDFTDVYVGEGNATQPVYTTKLSQNIIAADWETIVWTGVIQGRDKNLFTFTTAADGNPQVTFTPASIGNKNALLILTATFTKNSVEYTYSQPVVLTANALSQLPNELAFADLTNLYAGQSTPTTLFANMGSGGAIKLTIKDKDGQTINPATLNMGITNGTTEAAAIQPQATAITDTFTIEAEQSANNHIQPKTIKTKLIVNPLLVWNWSELYYPSVNTNPVTVMDGSAGWTLTEKIVTYDVVQFTGNNPANYRAEVYDLVTGEYEVKFGFCNQHDDDTDPNDTIWFTSKIFRDPRYVRVEVNNRRTYKAVTYGEPNGISFTIDNTNGNSYVEITSLPNKTNSWTMHFLGIPDKLCFKPTSNGSSKAWQIEESKDAVTWTTTFTWAQIPDGKNFEHSLMPSTQYVRVHYSADGVGTMENVYVSKLEGIKFTPSKVYMPAHIGEKKEVAITYVSDKNVTVTSPAGEFTFEPAQPLPATTGSPYYNVANVAITNASCVTQKLTGANVAASVGTEVIPIQTFSFPQELPIVLNSDMPAERFYYVTTHTYHTTWNEETRTITMQNAVAKAQPYMIFHFAGAPTYISFNHNADGEKGQWIIHESRDGITWEESPLSDREQTPTYLKQIVDENAKYLRVTYNSLYSGVVELTDLRIIGEEGAFVDKTELLVEYEDETKNSSDFTVTAINLANGMRISSNNSHFLLTHEGSGKEQNFTLTSTSNSGQYADVFKAGEIEEIDFKVYFDGSKAVDYATITITNNTEEESELKIFATIQVTGIRKTLTDGTIRFYTGVPDGTDGEGTIIPEAIKCTLSGDFVGKNYRPISIENAFANGSAIFDYLFVFGETTTMDGTTTITSPTTLVGSNAKTPCYIYQKDGNAYTYLDIVENANDANKITQDFLYLKESNAETLKVYITGFCPYASTGYTKEDEGVFCFKGGSNDNVHVYLQDCYIFSRSKTEDGHYFEGRYDGNAFTEQSVRGSGAVLVFECQDAENLNTPFNVSIHTRDNNMFKSHYGCFLESMAGRAFQVSAPVQIHMLTSDYIRASRTVLNFDDLWPNVTSGQEEHTNGFISLQKQHNNAPSIDLGNPNTIVNFNGGRVELQNAGNVSDNYNSTLAISYRGGRFAGFFLAYGLGSDEVSGTVNFYDGTTTVKRMKVEERYRQYYLMDEDGEHTSCLRTPKNTFVFGGSHCMMRACESATSKGGAPTDGNSPLGKFEYKEGYTDPAAHPYGLVTPTEFPNDCYMKYYAGVDGYQENAEGKKCYGLNSISPVNGAINLWLPTLDEEELECDEDEIFDVNPELDQKISFWKACMTKIEAHYVAGDDREVGGDVNIAFNQDGEQIELVSNLLYCKIDNSIKQIIGSDTYQAPVKNPMTTADAEDYIYIKPTKVGEQIQHYVSNTQQYRIEDKVYYITTAEADTWMTFTAPFDVENIYVMEAYPEALLEDYALTHTPGETRYEQARHNANFAAFFGVAMCIHPNKTFDMIYSDFADWAKQEHRSLDFGKQLIVPYSGSNFSESNAYIYHNKTDENWTLGWETNDEGYTDPVYTPNWERVVGHTDGKIMQQGETYSLLFPFCTGCPESVRNQFWDYWSGKFLIFESTGGPHQINGSDFMGAMVENIENMFKDPSNVEDLSEAVLSGNSTFAQMSVQNDYIFSYIGTRNSEYFWPTYADPTNIEPTTAFLYAMPPHDPATGMPAKAISRTGQIIYDVDNNGDGTVTGGHIPTVGGGNDLFITETANGINIAVAEAQLVRVLSSTGAVLYSGMVQTAVDVTLPTTGVYVVAGENEVHKILH